jgi:hypothetical protein
MQAASSAVEAEFAERLRGGAELADKLRRGPLLTERQTHLMMEALSFAALVSLRGLGPDDTMDTNEISAVAYRLSRVDGFKDWKPLTVHTTQEAALTAPTGILRLVASNDNAEQAQKGA